ncbi:OmpA family protein [Hymenobacter caeli]|uniref:Outer membrane protein OmpA-like peptidoglycan-associated protein n=1 Tax=Hymenobacter caeli TaxID=2735894 RepID=A0ABX2FQ12_9BACT|nr:OmpA family protein [Hymenobacter caeli]NRT19257.1 outer membrane protein OmpA-like peptidoglycan-associated protein [Hymenobacter caeli]
MRNFLFVCAAAGSAALLGGCAITGGGSADKRFARGEYETAIPLYKAQVAKGKEAPAANYRIGESYRLSDRAEQAEPFYKAALDGKVRAPDAGFHYAEALRANGKFDEAAAQFSAYATSGTNRPLAARAETDAKNALASKALVGLASGYDVRPLDSLNSAASDFGATVKPDTKEFVFASGRGGKKYLGNGENFTDLYAVKFSDAAAMTGGTVAPLAGPFNSPNRLEASATYTPDGRTVVFARSNDGSKKGYLSVDLWISYYKTGEWSEPVLANINDRTADDFAPVFAPDGVTLYFASGRRSGLGGNDLFKATLGPNGRFSPAENLGDAINTAGNDNFPGVAPDGTLYFSSDGRPGYGKLDIFMVKGGQAVNLGPDVNGPADDFAPFPMSAETGVFSSNRAGGKGSDDLYAYKKKALKTVNFFVDGTVLERDAKLNTLTPVASGTVTMTGPDGRKTALVTGPDGKFTAPLDSASRYDFFADRPGDFSTRATLSTVGRKPAQSQLTQPQNDIRLPVTLTLNKIVVNKAIEVKDIFYDYDKFNIRPDAAVRLDTLVQTLADNPKINIELSSHTDQRGKDAYNLKLSQRRAEAAVDYIVSKGIDRARITARGYGETRPIIVNPKSEADYQRNRRTEFKVTRIDK